MNSIPTVSKNESNNNWEHEIRKDPRATDRYFIMMS